MKIIKPLILIFCFFAGKIIAQTTALTGHSHNDYVQKQPFTTAFNAKMGSIEADVHLRDGHLYVAHDSADIKPHRTLDELYLKPVVAQVKKGKIYPLVLLIDIKTQAETTLNEVIQQIGKYVELTKNNCPITFVISGNRPKPDKWATYPVYILFDGRPYENYSPEQWQRIGMVSDNFIKFTDKESRTTLTQKAIDKMKPIVESVHAKGKKIRFWATSDDPSVWQALMDLQVDFINTDAPDLLHTFLEKAQSMSLKSLSGKWFIHYTNFPMWLKGDKTQPTFNYTIQSKGTSMDLTDRVEYLKKGKLKTIIGFDTPTDSTHLKFVWRGKGLLSLLKSRWQIIYTPPSVNWAIIQFENTLFTPKGYDIIARNAILDEETERAIELKLKELQLKDVLKRL